MLVKVNDCLFFVENLKVKFQEFLFIIFTSILTFRKMESPQKNVSRIYHENVFFNAGFSQPRHCESASIGAIFPIQQPERSH